MRAAGHNQIAGWLRAADQRLEQPALSSTIGAWIYARLAPLLLRDLYRQVIADAKEAAPEGALLDLGSGPGELMAELSRQLPASHVTGIDPAPAMLRLAEGRAVDAGLVNRIHLVRATAERLPFPDGSFDLVVSTLALHHFKEPVRAIAEAWRVLRPGAALLIYDFAPVTYAPEELRSIAGRTAFGSSAVKAQRLSGGWGRRLFVRYQLRRGGAKDGRSAQRSVSTD